MRYRTRLTLLLIALAVVTNGVVVFISYWLTHGILIEEIQSKVLSIASTAAAMVDGDLHQQIKSKDDEQSLAYKTLEARLRKFRNANRRDDVRIRYVYTMAPSDISPSNPYGAIYIVDAEERDTGNKSHVGEPVETSTRDVEPLDITKHQIDAIFEDKYGTWTSANAPIHDGEGNPVASLGVDMDVKEVLAKTNRLFLSGVFAMLVAALIACGIAMVLSRRVTQPLDLLTSTIQKIGEGDLNVQVNLETNDEFDQLGGAVNNMAKALRDREMLKGTLARYLSHQVADKIIRSGAMPELKGERRKVTIMFLDIRNFSDMADNLAPEKVVVVLNQFFEKMIEVIFRHKGTLDKFTGDGLMAIFGAPLDDDDQEYHAACAAVEMEQELDKLRALWHSEGKDQLRIGMGIHTGVAVVGNIGSNQRMDYTAIGDTVNLAARLESATKDHNVSILLSEQTHAALRNRFDSSYMDTLQLKGHAEPVSVYTIRGFGEDGTELN